MFLINDSLFSYKEDEFHGTLYVGNQMSMTNSSLSFNLPICTLETV